MTKWVAYHEHRLIGVDEVFRYPDKLITRTEASFRALKERTGHNMPMMIKVGASAWQDCQRFCNGLDKAYWKGVPVFLDTNLDDHQIEWVLPKGLTNHKRLP